MFLTNANTATYTPDEAERVAEEYQRGDPDWTYVPLHGWTEQGASVIEILDEDNEHVTYVTQ